MRVSWRCLLCALTLACWLDLGGCQSFKDYYNRLWGVGQPRDGGQGRGVASSHASPSSTREMPALPALSATDLSPPRLPPGTNTDNLPKSQLAMLTGDVDYTRFRQLFLREMCSRLLAGPKSSNFRFCFSILAL